MAMQLRTLCFENAGEFTEISTTNIWGKKKHFLQEQQLLYAVQKWNPEKTNWKYKRCENGHVEFQMLAHHKEFSSKVFNADFAHNLIITRWNQTFVYCIDIHWNQCPWKIVSVMWSIRKLNMQTCKPTSMFFEEH